MEIFVLIVGAVLLFLFGCLLRELRDICSYFFDFKTASIIVREESLAEEDHNCNQETTPLSLPVTAIQPALNDNTIIIALDATPRRAGGLLIFPFKTLIYFYSIDWSKKFIFPPGKPETVEMTNALLAINLFQKYLEFWRTEMSFGSNLVVKCDSQVALYPASLYTEMRTYEDILQLMHDKIKSYPFNGMWMHSSKINDPQLQFVERLSNENHSESIGIQLTGMDGESLDFYKQNNISKMNDCDVALETIGKMISK